MIDGRGETHMQWRLTQFSVSYTDSCYLLATVDAQVAYTDCNALFEEPGIV